MIHRAFVKLLAVVCACIGATTAATVTLDPSVQYQTIDGFGGFGGMVSWCCNPEPYTSQEWVDLMVDTLGLTLLRTELYPQPDQTSDYTKQIPALRAIMAKAQASGEPLKVFGTIWTPPGRMKDNHSAIGGGHLLVDSIPAYGTYLVNYVRQFNRDMGYDLYALSPQNEPALGTGYNSCTYYPSEFATMMKGVAAKFKEANLPCWIHYADNIPWGTSDWQGQVIQSICQDPVADSIGDIMSMHYDGDDACFAELRRQAAGAGYHRTVNIGKKSRMWDTEWGGFFDSWDETRVDENGGTPRGAWTCARNLFRCLTYDFNAVIYWALGDEKDPSTSGAHYSMYYRVNGHIRKGPLFNVCRMYYRFVRPGAVRIGCSSSDTANVKAIAFTHAQQQTSTIVLLNISSSQQSVTVNGTGLPSSMTVYQTSPTQNCQNIGTVAPGGSIALPVKSVTTLYNTPVTSVVPAIVQRTPHAAASRPTPIYAIDGRLVSSSVVRHAPARGVYVRALDGTARQVNITEIVR